MPLPVMLRHVTLRYVTLRHAILRRVMPLPVMLQHAMLRRKLEIRCFNSRRGDPRRSPLFAPARQLAKDYR